MIREQDGVYIVTVPYNHGMGEAIKWLHKLDIDYRWKNCKDTCSLDSVDKTIEYHFKRPEDAMLFLLRWR